jgi:hypothetical protein
MRRYYLSIINSIIFLLVFIGIPYVIGNWVALLWSWLPALLIAATLEENIPND